MNIRELLQNKYILLMVILTVIRVSNCDLFDELQKDEKFLGGFLKPVAAYIDSNPNVYRTQCVNDIVLWQKNITSRWALEMHDANGKFPPGIMTGNLHTLGQFDECLSVEGNEGSENRIKGKYCLATIPLNVSRIFPDVKMARKIGKFNQMDESERTIIVDDQEGFTFFWALCFPASCQAKEIQNLITNTINSQLRTNSRAIVVQEKYCSEKQPLKLKGATIALIVVSALFIFIVLISTGYDFYSRQKDKGSGRLHTALISFSAYTNSIKLTSINKNSSSLKCLHGIRVLSMYWIILSHRYSLVIYIYRLNSMAVIDWSQTYHSMIIIAGSVAVDSFFVMSGLLLAYVFFKKNNKKKFFNPLMFYFHRLVRLWPAMAAAAFAQGAIFEYLGDGPYWKATDQLITEPCRQYWWTTLLYVQNYVNPGYTCIGQTWYLNIDMQLYILSPILLYPLLMNTKFGIGNLVFWIVGAQAMNAAIVYTHHWSPVIGSPAPEESYFNNYYVATHMRATPWLLGFAMGYYLFKKPRRDIKMNKILVLFLWLASLAVMAAIVFGYKPMQDINHEVNQLRDGTYLAFARTAWAISVMWVIFACVHGYGGPINWFLSLTIWEVLGRFTYSMFLIHLTIQWWQLGSSKVTGQFSHISIIYEFFGDLLISIIFSYVWILMFELPFLELESALLGKPKVSNQIKRKNEEKTAD